MSSTKPVTQQAALKPGDRLELTLESWGRLGEAMAWHDGSPVFVFGGIPGERVVAEVLRLHRKYASATVVDVLEPAPERVRPPCPYFGECTGCQWQHLDYDAQLAVKRDKVIDALVRVGGLFSDPSDAPVADARPSANRYGYRNHARFTVSKSGALGFVNRETRRFVRIDHCMLMRPSVNSVLEQLQDRCRETTQLSIRAGAGDSGNPGEYLVQPPLFNPEITIATGQKRYVETVEDVRFFVSSPSFFQVNVEQAAQAAEVVRDGLSLGPDDVLLDAYTGVGAFAVLLAPYVGKVIAVEESAAAVADAKENAAGLPGVEFVLGRTENVLGDPSILSWPKGRPDVVVLDPPRSGCQPQALASLLSLSPSRVAYVSCDAETLARDLKILCGGGYSLDRVVPIDMFPQTHHVECVALLHWEGKSEADRLVLASASPRRRELMTAMGLTFDVLPADVPEDPMPGETPQAMVERLSRDKAMKVAASMEQGFVIGADSTVVHLGESFGKPVDDDEARAMLRRLRGTTHHVCTGLTVVDAATGRHLTSSMTSQITLRDFTDDEIEASIATGTPRDKAGAYAVQDTELRPASGWEGCHHNIVGLPTCRLLLMLAELGWSPEHGWTLPDTAACGPGCPNRPVVAAPSGEGAGQEAPQ
jgi:23S rRNA (uracil1939-C5)-methyltransferase